MTQPAETPRLAETDDQGHYFLAPFVAMDIRGETSYVPAFFGAGGYGSSYADLRPVISVNGYALVRTDTAPAELGQVPPEVIYLGQTLNAPLAQATRQTARTVLKVRGQITTAKDVVRAMYLTEAGEWGKPNALQAGADGSLLVHLGALTIDLAR